MGRSLFASSGHIICRTIWAMALTDNDAVVAEILALSKKRKAPVLCSSCDQEALYTWLRLTKPNAACRRCDEPLDANSLSYLKAQAALHFRIVNLRLAGRDRK